MTKDTMKDITTVRLRTDRPVDYQIRMLERKLRKLTKKFERAAPGAKLIKARILRTGEAVEKKLALLRSFRSKGIIWLGARRVG